MGKNKSMWRENSSKNIKEALYFSGAKGRMFELLQGTWKAKISLKGLMQICLFGLPDFMCFYHCLTSEKVDPSDHYIAFASVPFK